METQGYTSTTGEGQRRRMLRGVELYRQRSADFCVYLSGEVGVPSATEEDLVYHVDLDARDGRGICECPDHQHRTTICLHIYAGFIYRARRRSETRRASLGSEASRARRSAVRRCHAARAARRAA